jgi:Carboxypeptidase regulatory-like domain
MMKRVLLCVLGLSLLSAPLFAQTGVAELQGTVTDASGALIPGAPIALEHVQTGNKFQTSTNETGFFVFPSLQPGEYRLTVDFAGMDKWQGEVSLQVGRRVVVDPVLQVSHARQEVTVVGDVTPLVSTTSPTVATIVERQRIDQLPLNGRSIQTLLTITVPGLEGSSSQPKVYGLRDSSMDIVQDGVSLQDRNTGAIQSRPPGLDTVQEFRVETSVSSAKVERPASAVFSTRSGTNEFHGSVFETGRNSGFGVARQRQDTFSKAPHLVRNEFGASMGGPVVKNRTFFFGAWEEYRLRQGTTTASRVWTQAMRQGDFSGLIDSSGRKITLYDPWSVQPNAPYSKTPFPDNQLPISRLSPLAKYVFSVTPLPTEPNVNPVVADNYFGVAPTNINNRTLTGRLDHRLSERDQIFGRYSHGLNDQMNRRAFATGGTPITSDNLWNRETYLETSNTAMTSWTHTFSPTLFVETVGTVSLIDWQYSLNQPSANENISAKLGTPNPFDVNGAPVLTNLGYNAISYSGIVPRSQFTKLVGIEQNYSWVKQAHQLEFGGRFRQENLDTLPDRPNQSTLSFDSSATALYNPATGTAFGTTPQTGDNAANFFLGIAASYQQSRPPGRYDMHGRDLSAYLQDNWKVSRDLTLNLGLRWEYLGPYLDSKGMTSVWDFPSKSLVKNVSIARLVETGYTTQPIADGYAGIGVKWTTPDKVGLPDSMVDVSKHDFSPRIGFAYNAPFGGRRLVVRGGYGLYHFPIPARTFSELRLNPPLQGSYSFSWNNSAQTADQLPNYFTRFAPTVIAGANSTSVLDISQPPTVLPGVQITGLANNLPTSKAHEWNFVLESEVIKDLVVRASWIGTAGRNLEMMQLYNTNPISNYVWYVTTGQPLPTGFYSNTARRTLDQTTYGDIRIYSKIGYSNFNGIQLEAERRYRRGLALQFFYLLSNSSSTGATPSQGGDFTVNAINQPDRFLSGTMPQDLDQRIRFYRYSHDADIPKHRIRWNALVDLPFGRGKKLLGGVGTKFDRLIGGWQVAAYGTINSRWWVLPTGNWGTLSDREIYGTKYSIQDCRSGPCFQGYLYYNGYIPANRINVAGGVQGVPQNYKPSSQPIVPTPADGGSPTDPNRSNYETNNVLVPLKNGTNQLVNFDTGLHPWRNQVAPGPWLSSSNASLYKSVAINERVGLRIGVDAFNVFNQPGLSLPDSTTGILSTRFSAQGARTLQYTARLTW